MIKIIPAIDIINGHCVRLSQGDYQRITDYSESPAAMAENFEALGFKRLHVVDLDGARSGKVINIKALKEITSRTNLIVDFGGGIKSEEDLKNVFEAGASAVSIGSIAVSDPDIVSLWADSFGAEKFIISADVRDNIVRTNGWTKDSAGYCSGFCLWKAAASDYGAGRTPHRFQDASETLHPSFSVTARSPPG